MGTIRCSEPGPPRVTFRSEGSHTVSCLDQGSLCIGRNYKLPGTMLWGLTASADKSGLVLCASQRLRSCSGVPVILLPHLNGLTWLG